MADDVPPGFEISSSEGSNSVKDSSTQGSDSASEHDGFGSSDEDLHCESCNLAAAGVCEEMQARHVPAGSCCRARLNAAMCDCGEDENRAASGGDEIQPNDRNSEQVAQEPARGTASEVSDNIARAWQPPRFGKFKKTTYMEELIECSETEEELRDFCRSCREYSKFRKIIRFFKLFNILGHVINFMKNIRFRMGMDEKEHENKLFFRDGEDP